MKKIHKLLSLIMPVLICLSVFPASAMGSSEEPAVDEMAASATQAAAETEPEAAAETEPETAAETEPETAAETEPETATETEIETDSEALPALDGAEQLDTPTELTWGRQYTTGDEYLEMPGYSGYASFRQVAGAKWYTIAFLRAEDDSEVARAVCMARDNAGYLSCDTLTRDQFGSGDYYFTAVAGGGGTAYSDSEPAVSPVWHYDAPEEKLGLCTDIYIDIDARIHFTFPDSMDKIGGYVVEVYAGGRRITTLNGYTRSGSSRQMVLRLADRVVESASGESFQARARAVSADITAVRTGDFSPLSEGTVLGPDRPDPVGTCGDDLTWTLQKDGTLRISGTGAMTDFATINDAPWLEYSYRSKITRIVIEDGVTSVGAFAFFYCTGAKELSLPESLTSIGANAFGYCAALASVVIPGGVKTIGNYAFAECTALASLTLEEGVERLEYMSFAHDTALRSIAIPVSMQYFGTTVFYDSWGEDSGTVIRYAGSRDDWERIGYRGQEEDQDPGYFNAQIYLYAELEFEIDFRPGDADHDGAVSPLDAALILQYAVGLPVEIDEALADVDADGGVTERDAALILR